MAAEPIVLIHGLGHGAATWDAVLEHLSPRRVCTVDLPELRVTDRAPDFDAACRSIVSQLEAAGIERAHLVGHSYGGHLAIELALADRVRWYSLTTIETVSNAERWRTIASRMPARQFFAERHDVHVEDPQGVARMLAWLDQP